MKRKLLIPGVVVFEVCVGIYYLASFANGFKAPLNPNLTRSNDSVASSNPFMKTSRAVVKGFGQKIVIKTICTFTSHFGGFLALIFHCASPEKKHTMQALENEG